MSEVNDFCKIAKTKDGRQVLFYVEGDNGEYILHQIINFKDVKVDLKIKFTKPDEDENERLTHSALAKVNDEIVELVFWL